MFDTLIPYIGGILLITNITTGVSSWVKGGTIDDQALTIEKLTIEKALAEANTATLRGAIETRNVEVERLRVDLNASMEQWKNRTPSTVYVDRWLTKYVDRNVTTKMTRDDCENTHYIFDAIRDNF